MASILVVDDSILIRTQVREWLEEAGHTVIGEAETGIEAVVKYKELNPDITTLDIEMPVMDGMYALREIKEYDPGAHILMVSSHTKDGNVSNTLILGACEFVEKPLEKEEFIRMVKKLENYIEKKREKE